MPSTTTSRFSDRKRDAARAMGRRSRTIGGQDQVGAHELEQPKTAIVTALDRILSTDLFVVEQASLVRQCLEAYSRGKGDFADYIISRTSAENGCRETVTFDRALRGEMGFTVLG